jgi:ribonucleoside-diphosphate reductase alpha chain
MSCSFFWFPSDYLFLPIPLSVLCGKLSHMRFDPSGWTGNPKIVYAKSIMDYIFRWMELRFLTGEQGKLFETNGETKVPAQRNQIPGSGVAEVLTVVVDLGDAPLCVHCGSLMVRSSSCYRCLECGSTSGCS